MFATRRITVECCRRVCAGVRYSRSHVPMENVTMKTT